MARKITPLKIKKAAPLKSLNYQSDKTKGLMSEFEGLKGDFAANTFENLYADISNPYANMQNVWEEGQIAMKGYETQKDLLARGLSTTLQQQREAGGNINVQNLANVIDTQGQRISADIQKQEMTNLNLAKQEASKIQERERMGDFQVQQMRIKGEEDTRNLQLQQQQALLSLVSGQIAAGKQEDWKTTGWLRKISNLF
jgi:uncharacterized protein YutD